MSKKMSKEEIIEEIRRIVNSQDPSAVFEKELAEYEKACKDEEKVQMDILEALKNKIADICEKLYPDGYEVYTSSYDEELAYCQPSVIKELLKSDDPRLELSCKISDAAFGYGIEYGERILQKVISGEISEYVDDIIKDNHACYGNEEPHPGFSLDWIRREK